MARPLRIAYPGALYHITSRGNERKDIFKSQRDREKFISYVESVSMDNNFDPLSDNKIDPPPCLSLC